MKKTDESVVSGRSVWLPGNRRVNNFPHQDLAKPKFTFIFATDDGPGYIGIIGNPVIRRRAEIPEQSPLL